MIALAAPAPPLPALRRWRPRVPAALRAAVCCPDDLVIVTLAVSLVLQGNWALALLSSVALPVWAGGAMLVLWRLVPSSATLRLLASGAVGVVALLVATLPAQLLVAASGGPLAALRLAVSSVVVISLVLLRRALAQRQLSVWRWLAVPWSPLGVLLVGLPASAAMFAAIVLAGGSPSVLPAWVALGLAVGSMLLALLWRRDLIAPALFGVAWSVALALTFRSPHLFGFDINQEFGVASAARGWLPPKVTDPYASMLSITALPRSFNVLFGLTLADFFKLLAPAALAAATVAVWQSARLWASDVTAASVTLLLVVLSSSFGRQMPAISRQEIAFFTLTSAFALGQDERLPVLSRRWLLAGLAAALGFLHYTSSYVTVALLAGVWVTGRLLPAATRCRLPVAWWSVALVLTGTLLWNFGVTSSGNSLSDSIGKVADSGLSLLPSDGNVLQAWISGTSAGAMSAEEYSLAVADRVASDPAWSWLSPSRHAPQFPLADAAAPRETGLVPQLAPLWQLAQMVTSQLFLVSAAGFSFLSLVAGRRRGDAPLFFAGSLAFAAAAVSGLLRVSGALAAMYNPERQALLTSMLAVPLLAAAISAFGRLWLSRVLVVLFVPVTFLATTGLAAVLFGGHPHPARAVGGEDVERFVVTERDLASVSWMNSVAPAGALLQTDRYGQLPVISLADKRFGWVATIAPSGLHQQAYVLQTAANSSSGRARGEFDGDIAVFEFPVVFLDATREVVYVNGGATIWR